ncbi:MAG: ABC transporter ATP-binding protein, partial [Gemmatimonadales bacterium]
FTGTGAPVTRNLVLLFLGALLIKNVASYVAAYVSVLVQEGLVRDLRQRLYRHLLRLELTVFQRTRGGQLAAGIVSDTDQVKLVVVAAAAAFFQNMVLIMTYVTVMMLASVRLTLMVLLLAPILVIGIQLLLKRLKRYSRAFVHERGELTSTVTERLGAMKLIRAFGAEAAEGVTFDAQAERYRKGFIRTQRYALMTSPVSELFGGAMIMLIMWAASNRELSGVIMDAPTTLVFLVAALRMMSPVKSITQFPAQLAISEASAERVFALLDLPDTESDVPSASAAVFAREIRFDHVTFGYDPLVPVLVDVSLTIRKGEVVALVGPSGAGKTTMLELVPRFHDPQQGTVFLDDAPLPTLSRSSLRSLIAVVSQDTVLLHDTVRANIAYGAPGASDDAIEQAARAANAHEFIVQLGDGYHTTLGERGTRLSGGQRQRIAIARALLRDAPILILDEATSALDTESERLVQEAIDRLMQDRTVLVIAHRLATVRDADRIVVLESGRAVESGPHGQLLERGGLYRRLHDLQFSAAEVTS